MKERPILFSGPMVRAILEGRKTQTRRIVKMPKVIDDAKWGYTAFTPDGHISVRGKHADGQYGESFVKCPYGKPGDRLWVRETWCPMFSWDRDTGNDFPKEAAYKATPDDTETRFGRIKNGRGQRMIDDLKWKPSIHMPRWASRISLEVVSVRVERLQDISNTDAFDEGCTAYDDQEYWEEDAGGAVVLADTPRDEYQTLWNAINGEGSWQANPWVWVVEFKRVPQP